MGMGIGTNTQKPDEGEIKGIQEEIACGIWFTSTGRTIPKMIKFMDHEGVLQVIDNIRILKMEKKYYCGIPLMEYNCSTLVGNQEYLFKLYYYLEDCIWKIEWKK